VSVVLDASAVVAIALRRDPCHESAVEVLETTDEDLVTSPLCLGEMDFVVPRRGGPAAQAVLWRNFADGAYQVRWWADALHETIAVAREHPRIGLADASLVALADRLQTDRIFTFDQHFAGLVTPAGRTLTLVP
jgi:predicted nucleic acid-binding protein